MIIYSYLKKFLKSLNFTTKKKVTKKKYINIYIIYNYILFVWLFCFNYIEMKKYRHKKTGYIAQQCAGINYQLLKDIECNTNIPKEIVENSCDWEEVVEKDYEILSFKQDSKMVDLWIYFENKGWCRNNNGKPETSPYKSLDSILNNHLNGGIKYDIYSVKRLSDGEIFTIGDKIDSTISDLGRSTDLTGFKIIDGKLIVGLKHLGFYPLSTILLPKKPLFTTEDGVDIFEGDYYHSILKDSLYYQGKFIGEFPNKGKFTNHNCKTFSTKEAAEEYILMNKSCLSVNDFNELWLNSCRSDAILEKVKELAKEKIKNEK